MERKKRTRRDILEKAAPDLFKTEVDFESLFNSNHPLSPSKGRMIMAIILDADQEKFKEWIKNKDDLTVCKSGEH
ncbi:MAG: hypothetical protein QW445_03685 [Candidatus Bathyarchaeia archaeon]